MDFILQISILDGIFIVILFVLGLTVLVGFKTKKLLYLKILLGIYIFTFSCFSIFMYSWNNDIKSMNSVSTRQLDENIATLTFKPEAKGEYGIYIKLLNENTISEIYHCSSLEIININKEKNVDQTALKKCYTEFGDGHISTTINGKKESLPVEIILGFINNKALLRDFIVDDIKTYKILVVIDKGMKKILGAKPLISIEPTEINRYVWRIYFFSYYLPFGLAILMSFVFYINRSRAYKA